jgi:probable addiction module antidote protein
MKRAMSYKEGLLERLKDKEYSVNYLTLALKDEDSRVFVLALKDVIKAHGGIGKASKRAKLSRASVYKMLSGERELGILKILRILDTIGIALRVFPKA